jgi:hypothetical protein
VQLLRAQHLKLQAVRLRGAERLHADEAGACDMRGVIVLAVPHMQDDQIAVLRMHLQPVGSHQHRLARCLRQRGRRSQHDGRDKRPREK